MTAPAIYLPAPDVAAAAEPIIADHHQHLVDAPIIYCYRSPALRSKGRTVLGRAVRILGLNAFLAALAAGEVADELTEAAGRRYGFFVMEIALEEWRHATNAERKALVDHELSHMAVDEETGELKIRAHDVEEFISIADRHGAWSPDLAALVEVCATAA